MFLVNPQQYIALKTAHSFFLSKVNALTCLVTGVVTFYRPIETIEVASI